VYGVQWHPEFMGPTDPARADLNQLDPNLLLQAFLRAVQAHRAGPL
jgi:hypothetical protein